MKTPMGRTKGSRCSDGVDAAHPVASLGLSMRLTSANFLVFLALPMVSCLVNLRNAKEPSGGNQVQVYRIVMKGNAMLV